MTSKIGDQFRKDFIITESQINDFCSVIEDHNPVHLDDEFARLTIFKKRIAPGMLVASLISAVLGNNFPGIGTIYLSQTMKFHAPAFINDCISVHIEVIEIKRNNWLTLKTECFNQHLEMILSGEAVVLPPNNDVSKA